MIKDNTINNITQIQNMETFLYYLDNKSNIILVLSKENCKPCQRLKQIIQALDKDQYINNLLFLEIKWETQLPITKLYKLFPTLLYYKNGMLKNKIQTSNKKEFIDFLNFNNLC